MLGKLESYGRVGEARGVGKDFVLYAFSEESAIAGQQPINCLVVPYNGPQNSIPLHFRCDQGKRSVKKFSYRLTGPDNFRRVSPVCSGSLC